jgi:transposase
MSLRPKAELAIPEETRRVAQAIFHTGNSVMRIRDELGALYADDLFEALFPKRGQPAESPGRLAWVTVLQFAEGLTDRQAAEAVRRCIDWKYALALELTDAGFHYSVLSEFRTRLVHGGAEQQLLDRLLQACQAHGWLKARGPQRTDSTHVLGAIRELNRLELVGETLRHVLECVAVDSPDWLRSWVPPDWFERYARRFENYRLPKARTERDQLAGQIGRDGLLVLGAVAAPNAPASVKALTCMPLLRQVWIQQFIFSDGSDLGAGDSPPKPLRFRVNDELPVGAEIIFSPYDVEVRYSAKRETEWIGYKVHVTETCADDELHLITHVETTPASTADVALPHTLHAALQAKALLPSEHFVDAAYTDADEIVSAQVNQGVTVCGPVHVDTSWQAVGQTGYDIAHFSLDWPAHQALCPQGQRSHTWLPIHNKNGRAAIEIRFARADCQPCPARTVCTRAKSQARVLQIRPQAQHEAIQNARLAQTTAAFRKRYAKRAGIEATLSQGVRAFELRRTRYIGLARTHLQHLATAVAINLARIVAALEGIPIQPTRQSHFARLAAA